MPTKKKKIILASHGDFACAALSTLEMISGNQPDIIALKLVPGEGIEELYKKYEEIVLENQKEGVLILTDIAGGTPSNAATQLLLVHKNIQVFAGFNLPLLLDIVTSKWETLENLKQLINSRWSGYLIDVNQKINQSREEEADSEY